MVQVRVRDWGNGIPEQDLDSVFDPFNRIRGAEVVTTGEGAGLGLALCRQVVGRHDGTIRARFAESVGLEVEIELPVHARL